MKMIEIIRDNHINLINKSEIEVGVNFSLNDDNYFICICSREIVHQFSFINSIAADKFYQKIKKSLLSDDKINVIVYDEEEGVL